MVFVFVFSLSFLASPLVTSAENGCETDKKKRKDRQTDTESRERANGTGALSAYLFLDLCRHPAHEEHDSDANACQRYRDVVIALEVAGGQGGENYAEEWQKRETRANARARSPRAIAADDDKEQHRPYQQRIHRFFFSPPPSCEMRERAKEDESKNCLEGCERPLSRISTLPPPFSFLLVE